MAQLHKKFTDAQVKELLARYCRGEIPRRYWTFNGSKPVILRVCSFEPETMHFSKTPNRAKMRNIPPVLELE